MQKSLDANLAERIAEDALGSLYPVSRNKILCRRGDAKLAILEAIEEAYQIGFLAGRENLHAESCGSGSPDRLPWMDIPIDNPNELARLHSRLTPIVVNSLRGAGYRLLGDLRWVSERKLAQLKYIGPLTARKIVAAVRRCERAGNLP